MAEMKRGHIKSPETIAKLKAAAAASTWRPSAEHIEKLRAANTGRKHGPESLEKWRQQMVGRKQPASQVANRVAALTGKKRTPEQCARIAEAKKGHGAGQKRGPRPPHVIEAMREGHRRWVAARKEVA